MRRGVWRASTGYSSLCMYGSHWRRVPFVPFLSWLPKKPPNMMVFETSSDSWQLRVPPLLNAHDSMRIIPKPPSYNRPRLQMKIRVQIPPNSQWRYGYHQEPMPQCSKSNGPHSYQMLNDIDPNSPSQCSRRKEKKNQNKKDKRSNTDNNEPKT